MMKELVILLATLGAYQSLPWDVKDDAETALTSTTDTPTDTKPTYDYVVEIGFNLNEDKVPEYLIEVIYENSSENSITTDDVLSLYGLKTITLDEVLDILNDLNIDSEYVFNLNGFDNFLTELLVDFKEFYNKVIIGRLNITGYPLRDLLVALDVNINNFSMGMAYGDPDPYEEFKKGNFSKEAVDLALQKAGKTLDDLFVACRDEFLSKAAGINTKKIIESLVRYSFDKSKALQLWNLLSLSMENVYKVPAFKQVLNELSRELNKKPSLGVLTAPNNITINKKVYNTWKHDEDVVTLYAESITHKFILQITDTIDVDVENIILLKSVLIEPNDETTLPYIDIGTSSEDLAQCKFVTLQNGTVIIKDISVAVNHESYFEIPKDNITELVPGSPLICENKVFGIAREISSGNIILDSFSSGVSRIIINGYLLGVALTACVCIYFL